MQGEMMGKVAERIAASCLTDDRVERVRVRVEKLEILADAVSAGALGAACGPALGGLLTQLISWDAIFFVQVPAILLALPTLRVRTHPVLAPAGRPHVAANLALALGAIGVFAKAISVATTPEADTRSWDNLPQFLSAGTITLTPGAHEATLEFFDANERRIDSLTRKLTVTVASADRDTVVFLSELPR